MPIVESEMLKKVRLIGPYKRWREGYSRTTVKSNWGQKTSGNHSFIKYSFLFHWLIVYYVLVLTLLKLVSVTWKEYKNDGRALKNHILNE